MVEQNGEPFNEFEEPIRRYLRHAMPQGRVEPARLVLTMTGRIRAGPWLDFDATQCFAGHSFEWRAQAGTRRWKPLHVVDTYSSGIGSTSGTVFGRVPFMRAADENTARAAAGRAAAESIWVPYTLASRQAVDWRVEDDNHIVATVDVPPERPEVHLHTTDSGAPTRVEISRWGKAGQRGFGYIPFGGHVGAERRFGDLVLPTEVSVGWWFGTSRYEPFFEAKVRDVASPFTGPG